MCRGGQGCGKTHFFAVVAKWLVKKYPGWGQLTPSHRCALVADVARRLGFASYDAGEHDAQLLATTYNSLPMVPLVGLDGRARKWSLLILDEVSQALRYIVGGTIKQDAPEVLQHLQAVAANTEMILCGDADADADTVAKLRILFPDRPVVILNNTYRATDLRATVYDNEMEHQQVFLADVAKRIPSMYLTLSGPAHAEKMAKLVRAVWPGVRVLVCSADTSTTPEVVAALADINAALKNYDVVIGTPTLGSGVDIQDPRFERVFVHALSHDIGADGLVQLGFRARQSKEWHVFVARRPRYRDTDPRAIARELLRVSSTGKAGNDYAFQYNPKVLPVVGVEPRMVPLHAASFWLFTEAAAHVHRQTNDLRASTIARLREGGFTVTVKAPPDADLTEQRKRSAEAAVAVKLENAEELAAAADVDLDRADELMKARVATRAELLSAKKAIMGAWYEKPVTVDLVLEDNSGRLRTPIKRLASLCLTEAGEHAAAAYRDVRHANYNLPHLATANLTAASWVLPTLLERFGMPRGAKVTEYAEVLRIPELDPDNPSDGELLLAIRELLGVNYRRRMHRGEVTAPVDTMYLLTQVLKCFALGRTRTKLKRDGKVIPEYRIDLELAAHRIDLAQAEMERARAAVRRWEDDEATRQSMAAFLARTQGPTAAWVAEHQRVRGAKFAGGLHTDAPSFLGAGVQPGVACNHQ